MPLKCPRQVKLVNFRHNRFESHGSASFCEAKEGKLGNIRLTA
jgi:hypothetical protein